MNKIEYIIGFRRKYYNTIIPIRVFVHFFLEILYGKFPIRNFSRFLRRLLFFLTKMKDNKYVKSGKEIKLNLYVPAFPTDAFYKACKKVEVKDEKMPCISVLISVSSACRYNCEHCYQKLDKGKDINIDLLSDLVKELDNKGIAFFNIEGGEPFLVYNRLRKLCSSISNGEIWINSTGDGMSKEKLAELKNLGVKGIMFSIHSTEKKEINSFFKSEKAWDNFHKGILLCHSVGLDVAANSCLLKEDYYNGKFQSLMEFARELGISILQLIKPKPSGGWLKENLQFSKEDLEYIEGLVHNYNNKKEYKMYPFIAAQIIDEKSEMFGCTAGGTDRFYINAKGDVQPCEFLNISYGNIKDEDFCDIYARMRKSFDVPGSTWICETCSHTINEIMKSENISTLPLSKEVSKKVIDNWNRGEQADFYKKVIEK